MPLPYGIAGHGTFSTVFRCLNQVAFEAALPKPLQRAWKAWWRSTARRYEATPLPLVKVWAAGCGLVIGQQTAPGRNEVQGALDALALLSLEGAIVTADALHCRADTAHAILSAGATMPWR
ncbi:transposase [Rhizobium leguminosarum bv. phaseoli CCGM1]|nr:transposase [Rhizobium leguminosarum bv. phaseoli CCGM1]